MTARCRRAAAALAGFLRGFLGLESAASEPPGADTPERRRAARLALERRAGTRRSCC